MPERGFSYDGDVIAVGHRTLRKYDLPYGMFGIRWYVQYNGTRYSGWRPTGNGAHRAFWRAIEKLDAQYFGPASYEDSTEIDATYPEFKERP